MIPVNEGDEKCYACKHFYESYDVFQRTTMTSHRVEKGNHRRKDYG